MPNLDDLVMPLLLPEYKTDPVLTHADASTQLPKYPSTGSQMSTQSNPI